MMTPEQSKIVTDVYNRFFEGEKNPQWDDIDDQLMHLEYLEDDQLIREAQVQFTYHQRGKVRCGQEFCNQGCYAKTVVEAVEAILALNDETGALHKNNRYILENYLALSHLGMIVSD